MESKTNKLPGLYFTIVFVLLTLSGCTIFKKNTKEKYKASVISYGSGVDTPVTEPPAVPVKNQHKLQIEFGSKMAISPDSIHNLRLYGFIKKWLGTPYLWGGTTANGIDCSAFVQQLYQAVYEINIPRTSIEQFYTKWVDLYANARYLKEGDLVFFKTMNNSNAVTHVGFYLHNGYFVNASSSKGVSLANLYDKYWRVKYVAAGRLKRGI